MVVWHSSILIHLFTSFELSCINVMSKKMMLMYSWGAKIICPFWQSQADGAFLHLCTSPATVSWHWWLSKHHKQYQLRNPFISVKLSIATTSSNNVDTSDNYINNVVSYIINLLILTYSGSKLATFIWFYNRKRDHEFTYNKQIYYITQTLIRKQVMIIIRRYMFIFFRAVLLFLAE